VGTIGNGSVAGNLGAATNVATNLVLGGGTLQYTGATASTNRNYVLTVGTTSTIDVTTSELTISGASTATTGALTKTGTGTLILSGNNLYTGTTTISAGKLLNNDAAANSAVSLNGGTLGGTGTVTSITSTTLGGTITPGNPETGPGILNSGNVNLAAGAPSFVVQLNGTTAGTGYDQLICTGTADISNATLSGTVGFSPAAGSTFMIINKTVAGGLTGTFAGLAEGATVTLSGIDFTISYIGGDVVLTRSATFTWDGGGPDDNWNTPANWVGNLAPSAGNNLVFNATGVGVRSSPNNNFAAGTNFGTITVAAAGYTISGNSVSLGTGLTANYAGGTSTISLILGGAGTVTVSGSGTLVLSGTNTFSGVTTINAGTLSVGTIGNGGIAGNLGQAAVAAGNIVLNGGTLQYTGSTASTNRNFTLNAGTSSTIEVTANTLTISGTSAVTTGALTKTGAGTLILSGANGHTGLTAIRAGTLQYGVANALSTGGVSLEGGTLSTGATTGYGDTVGTLDLSANSTINLGTGAHTLTFANSSGVGWSSGTTLTVTGWAGAWNGTAGTAGRIFVGAGGLTAGHAAWDWRSGPLLWCAWYLFCLAG
jgi:autotransporter-associated beta strand protein